MQAEPSEIPWLKGEKRSCIHETICIDFVGLYKICTLVPSPRTVWVFIYMNPALQLICCEKKKELSKIFKKTVRGPVQPCNGTIRQWLRKTRNTQSSGRWISPINMRLLWTLKPRSDGSICLPFFPFFLALLPDETTSRDSGSGMVFLVLFSISLNEGSATSASLLEEVRRNLKSFLLDIDVSETWDVELPPKLRHPPAPHFYWRHLKFNQFTTQKDNLQRYYDQYRTGKG